MRGQFTAMQDAWLAAEFCQAAEDLVRVAEAGDVCPARPPQHLGEAGVDREQCLASSSSTGGCMVMAMVGPLGVASSFTRGDLFRRWQYRARYQQMVTMTRCGTTDQRRFAALVPDDEPPDLVTLVRLHILDTVLIADAAAGRDPAHIAYETMITHPARRPGGGTASPGTCPRPA